MFLQYLSEPFKCVAALAVDAIFEKTRHNLLAMFCFPINLGHSRSKLFSVMECLKGKEAARKRKQYMDENRKQSYIVQTRPTKDTRPVLTDEQKQIVTCTWDIVKKDISRVGVITFLR